MRILAFAAAGLMALAGPAAADETGSWTTWDQHADPSASPLVQQGQKVFQARCDLCHGAIDKDVSPGMGAQMAGTLALQAKYKGTKPALLSQRTDLTADVVAYYVRTGSGIMPFFRKTEVSDADLKALEAYLTRNNKEAK